MSYTTKIVTNNVPREILYGFEVPEAHAEYDFLSLQDFEQSEFFKYKGEVYYLGDFTRLPDSDQELGNWNGIKNFSYSNGIVIRLVENEFLVVGYYYLESDI